VAYHPGKSIADPFFSVYLRAPVRWTEPLNVYYWEAAAWGSFLLFMTNFLAILLAGGIVLAIIGLGK
jgi:hypothetical protein